MTDYRKLADTILHERAYGGLADTRALTMDEWKLVDTALRLCADRASGTASETEENPAQRVPDGMWYFTFYCEDFDAVQRVRVRADAPRQFTRGVTGIALQSSRCRRVPAAIYLNARRGAKA